MGKLSGETTLLFSFLPLFIFFCFFFVGGGGSTLIGKNLLLKEQILSYKSRAHLGRATIHRETGSHRVVALCKTG